MKKKKILHIVRHAKSSWNYEGIADIDRPLKLKGIKDAYEMARRTKLRNSVAEHIITSPANRAFHTALIFAKVLDIPYRNIVIESAFFSSDSNTIVNLIKNTPDSINSLMIVGHNPDFTEIVNMFLKEPIFEMPTAGIASIAFKKDKWMEIGKSEVKDYYIDFPKKEIQIETK